MADLGEMAKRPQSPIQPPPLPQYRLLMQRRARRNGASLHLHSRLLLPLAPSLLSGAMSPGSWEPGMPSNTLSREPMPPGGFPRPFSPEPLANEGLAQPLLPGFLAEEVDSAELPVLFPATLNQSLPFTPDYWKTVALSLVHTQRGSPWGRQEASSVEAVHRAPRTLLCPFLLRIQATSGSALFRHGFHGCATLTHTERAHHVLTAPQAEAGLCYIGRGLESSREKPRKVETGNRPSRQEDQLCT